jgi:hypothetical protein
MSDPITEAQGRKIISLLEDVVSRLDGVVDELERVKSEVERLDGIHDTLNEANGHLSSIATDVGLIENKTD